MNGVLDMSLLDQLNKPTDGVQPAAAEGTVWRPSKDRAHPEGIEGTIRKVSKVPVKEPKENGPTFDFVLLVDAKDKEEPWRVYGSTRDLRDRFSALAAEGKLVEGKDIAIKFFGSRSETAKDGTKYSVHTYAVAVA